MVALIALLLILAIFGGLGFAAHILWIVLIIALVLWLIGFLIGGAEAGVVWLAGLRVAPGQLPGQWEEPREQLVARVTVLGPAPTLEKLLRISCGH